MQRISLPSQGGPRDLVRWALAGAEPGRVYAVTMPAPIAPLSAFLAAVPRDASFLWHPPEGLACAGSGATAAVRPEGPGRLDQLARFRDALFARTVHHTTSDDDPALRLYGGLAFQPGRARKPPWTSFGDGHFVLPRWSYMRSASRALLTFTTDGAVDRAVVDRELEAILRELKLSEGVSTATRIPAYRPIPASCVEQMPFETWERLLSEIKKAIASGAFSKLVATTRCEVVLREPLDDVTVITRLIAEPSCTRFAFRWANASFVGASPEKLFVKHGRDIRTDALAGTIRSLGSEPPVLRAQKTRLLESDKDAIEHDYVVREIEATLSRIATDVVRPDAPEVRKIRNILHLATPFAARLNDGMTAIDVIAALHPTPAVGGLPREGAAEWLAAHESHERGWYTGVVGWIDAVDDAELAIAIRSGVITSDRAYVMTGAGIVAASDVATELAEVQLKQLPLLRALGVESA